MNWKYINNQKIKIFKQECQKKRLCFHYDKKRHQVKKCRILQNQTKKSVKTQMKIITMTELCEKEWCQNMKCQQHHSRQNLVKNWLWFNKKTEWESSMQIWNKNDLQH